MLLLTLLFGVLILPTLVRKARLIGHIEDVGGFFYSYHYPVTKKLLGKYHWKVKSFVLPKVEPLLGPQWPGIFKEITHVGIDLRHGGSEWDLGYLRKQEDLVWLNIGELPIEPSELEVLDTLPSLNSLAVNLINLEANAVASLARLETLSYLALRGREPTREEAQILAEGLPGLKYLDLVRPEGEPVESEIAKIFAEQLPECRIIHDAYFFP